MKDISIFATVSKTIAQNPTMESSNTPKQSLQEPTISSTSTTAFATKVAPNTEYPFLSLCRVGSSQGSAITLLRLVDVVDGVIQSQRQSDAPNRDRLFTQDRSKPENFVGVWSWNVNIPNTD